MIALNYQKKAYSAERLKYLIISKYVFIMYCAILILKYNSIILLELSINEIFHFF